MALKDRNLFYDYCQAMQAVILADGEVRAEINGQSCSIHTILVSEGIEEGMYLEYITKDSPEEQFATVPQFTQLTVAFPIS